MEIFLPKALFLSFLRLFKENRPSEYVEEKHLDFYYNEMLGFSPRRGVEKSSCLFELNKNTQQVLIPKGTSFLAGKDAMVNLFIISLSMTLWLIRPRCLR